MAVEKYVGPLEEIVRLYQAIKASYDSDRGYRRLKPRELKRIAQYVADNLMETYKVYGAAAGI